MTRIIMYKANDGTLFKTRKEMAAHNANIKFSESLSKVTFNSELVRLDDRENRVIFFGDIREFIIQNADVLRKALGTGIKDPRGRKSKAVTPSEPEVVAG